MTPHLFIFGMFPVWFYCFHSIFIYVYVHFSEHKLYMYIKAEYYLYTNECMLMLLKV